MSPRPLRRGRDFRHFAVFLTSGVVGSTLKLRQNGLKLLSTSAVTPEGGQKSVKKSPLYCFGSHGEFRGSFYCGFEKLNL